MLCILTVRPWTSPVWKKQWIRTVNVITSVHHPCIFCSLHPFESPVLFAQEDQHPSHQPRAASSSEEELADDYTSVSDTEEWGTIPKSNLKPSPHPTRPKADSELNYIHSREVEDLNLIYTSEVNDHRTPWCISCTILESGILLGYSQALLMMLKKEATPSL